MPPAMPWPNKTGASLSGLISPKWSLLQISFHSNPKERQCQRMLKLPHNCTHLTHYQSNTKILQVRVQQYMNCELPHVQAGFRQNRGTRDQISSICWIIKKAREFQKNIDFCCIDYAKAFDCVDHNKLWKILKEMGNKSQVMCILCQRERPNKIYKQVIQNGKKKKTKHQIQLGHFKSG